MSERELLSDEDKESITACNNYDQTVEDINFKIHYYYLALEEVN